MAKQTLLPGTQFWGEQVGSLPIADVIRRYESGFAGVVRDQDASDEFWRDIVTAGGTRYGSDAATDNGWTDSAAGKLVATWMHVEKVFPGCWPGAAQERGDCVSHSQRNANLTTLCCEIIAGKPDEVTGKVEGIPDVPPKGISEGVLASAYLYWWRGYNGDGWNCDTAAGVSIKRGQLLMKPYSSLGVDLTEYSGSIAGKYGSRQPPPEIEAEGTLHVVRTATELQSFEEIRDFLANGYGISSCGGEGFSSSRNEDGVSDRRGSWAHAMAYIGADDRDETKSKYGGPLVLLQNSWGKFNSGPRTVRGTQLQIPEGSFWARWKDVSRRYVVAMSSIAGWPSKNLPDWIPEGFA